jgi:predicted pyridoxine 5'-phosphate oxidase superfamily flavin-nucleotide-binding protein
MTDEGAGIAGLFGPESRRFQDEFDTRRIADRINEKFVRPTLDEEQIRRVAEARMLFIATLNEKGEPECSYKGGTAGFLRVLDERTIAIPFYNGNGMFSTLGNIATTGRAGLLFVDFEDSYRLRVNGPAKVQEPQESWNLPGALKVAVVTAEVVYEMCERYVHKMKFVEESVYSPKEGYTPPPAPYISKPMYDGYRPGEPPTASDPYH